jgi:DNA-binding HxlR family transcriptional regulator
MDNNLLCIFPRHEECHMRNQCTKYSTCPMVVVQNLLSGKWKLLILWYLSYGTLRFSDIKNRLPKVTQKMLTSQLRSLEEDKLISRKVYPVVPPKVEYSLTEVGKEIIPILEMMHSFGSEYLGAGLLNTEEKDEDSTHLN